MAFPPQATYPDAIDSDYTLFLVYNTTETKLTADNSPWAQEIEILPVGEDEAEIWADNGFANIEGELLYYDSVAKDSNGKVNKLKSCARQLAGENTKFNKRGTWIRSFVVAEHHNQLVDAVMKTQDFIGYNFDPRIRTLDWRIRNLQSLDVIFDDFDCPDVNFTFNITENDPVRGVSADYLIEITPPGSISSFRLDFGDGDFTTSDLQGTHRYAINARIDPVVRFSNNKCQIIQTPIERTNPAEPVSEVQAVFEIPIPEIPDVPEFIFVPCTVPEPDITLPPLIIPCISVEGGSIPSVIIGPDINMVSQVTITANLPVQILHSVVSIIGGANIPSVILIDPPIPPTIIIDPPIPPTIVIIGPQSNLALDLDFSQMPQLEVDWGMPPNMEVALTMAKPVRSPTRFTTDPNIVSEFGKEFSDLFDANQTMKVEYESVGLPSEIKVILPEDDIGIDTGDLFNRKIQIDTTGIQIPEILLKLPETPLVMKFDVSDLESQIKSMPPIRVEFSEIPASIDIKMEKEIPNTILVEMPKPIPERIIVESNIPDKIVLIAPPSIPLVLPEGIGLPVIFPEKMPEIPIVWNGAPIEVKITMDQIMSKDANGNACVQIIPCKS